MPSHGSLTKAGKARNRTKVIWREGKKSKSGRPFHGRKRKIPRVRNRRNYEKRILLKRELGNKQTVRRRRRR